MILIHLILVKACYQAYNFFYIQNRIDYYNIDIVLFARINIDLKHKPQVCVTFFKCKILILQYIKEVSSPYTHKIF